MSASSHHRLVERSRHSRPGYKMLQPFQHEELDWSRGSFNYPDMVRVGTYADGSCFFHAIALAYFIPYRRGHVNEGTLDRIDFIKNLRMELSMKLSDNIDPEDPSSPTYYETISRGGLVSFGRDVPKYSLESMKNELASNEPIDNVYNEFISDILNKDIYLLDIEKQDVYVTGKDLEILYKERDSIVILYVPGHYEVVGLKDSKGRIKTLFSPHHDFIRSIQTRLIEKIHQGSKQ